MSNSKRPRQAAAPRQPASASSATAQITAQFPGPAAGGVAVISASSFGGLWTSNECMILLSRPNPFAVAVTPDGRPGAALEVVAVLELSPQSAKDLLELLRYGIQNHEKEWGEITTDNMRQLAKKSE